ncbi:hypothetical protein [Serratia fonticola]
MSKINERSEWVPEIYRLTTEASVLGFNAEDNSDGPSNVQAEQLANRTQFLKSMLDGIQAGDTPFASDVEFQQAINAGLVALNAVASVRSNDNQIWLDEYRNLNGIATPTGKMLPSSDFLSRYVNGMANTFAIQNMFYDDGVFDLWASAGTPGVPTIDPIGGTYSRGGSPSSYVVPYAAGNALHIGAASGSAYFQYSIDIAKIGAAAGGKVTVMLRAVGNAGSTGSQDRILIQQYDVNNTEIPGTRITDSHPSSPMRRAVEYSHTFNTAVNCVSIRLYISVSSPASFIEIDRVLVSGGVVDSYRPSPLRFRQGIIDLIPDVPEPVNLLPYIEAQGLENSQPNVFNAEAVGIVNLNATVVAIGSITASEINGTPAWRFTAPSMASSAEAGLSIGAFERSHFGNLVSVSFTLLALDANPDATANVRILLRQFSAAGTEIASARKTVASFDGHGFTEPQSVSFSGAVIDSACVKIDIFIGINNKANAATRSLYFREPLLASGVNTVFRRPPSDAAKIIKEFSSSGNVVPNSDFRGIGNVIPSTKWSTAVDIVDRHGERCVKIVGTVPATLVTTEKYDVSKFSSGKMSISLLIMEKVGNQGATSNLNNLRVRLAGYDAQGVRVNDWGNSPGNDGGGYNFYDRNIPLNDITSRTTLVIADNLTLPPGVAFITINFRTEGLSGVASPDMYFTKFSIREGADYSYRSSGSSTGTSGELREVWISQNGSDNNDGSKGSPFATADKALDAIGGSGSIYLVPGIFTGLQFDASKIMDVDIFGSDTIDHERTTIRYGVPVTGITKTEGYTKVYQATVSIAGQPSFIWLDGVADAQTLAPDIERHPLDRGRTHRVPWATKIYRAFERDDREIALAEIDGDSVPLCYKHTDPDTSTQTLYFSVPDGVEAHTASIYVANNNIFGFFKNLSYVWDARGKCRIHGIDIRYGGFNLKGFRYSEAFDSLSLGAPVNCFDIGWGTVLRLCEAAGAGSNPDPTGDGFNAHDIANWYHHDCYSHDCNDDGWSPHENCLEMGYNPVAIFNGGGGLTPAYGAHAKYYNPLTIRNSVNPRAVSSYSGVKFGGVTVVGNPVAGDDGAYTNCEVHNGISLGDKIGYNDDATRRGMRAYLVAYDCRAYDSVDMGYQCQIAVDCGYSGSAPARDSKTLVKTTEQLT